MASMAWRGVCVRQMKAVMRMQRLSDNSCLPPPLMATAAAAGACRPFLLTPTPLGGGDGPLMWNVGTTWQAFCMHNYFCLHFVSLAAVLSVTHSVLYLSMFLCDCLYMCSGITHWIVCLVSSLSVAYALVNTGKVIECWKFAKVFLVDFKCMYCNRQLNLLYAS